MIDADILQKIVDSVQNNRVEEVPAGFFTVKQFQEKYKLGELQAKRWLDAGVQTEVLESKMFRIKMPNGHTRKVTHYRSKTCTSRKK